MFANKVFNIVCGFVCASIVIVLCITTGTYVNVLQANAAKLFQTRRPAIVRPSGKAVGNANNTDIKVLPKVDNTQKPVTDKVGSACACDSKHYTQYVVKPGDTLSEISCKFGVSVDALAKVNDICDVNLIYAESVLRIPC